MKKVNNELIDERICNLCSIVYYEKRLKKLFNSLKFNDFLHNPLNNKKNEILKNWLKNSNQKEFAKAINLHNNIALNTDIYHSLLKVSLKLTGDEVIYLTNAFLINRSENDIAELMSISAKYLQKIKKSCIIKMWIELGEIC